MTADTQAPDLVARAEKLAIWSEGAGDKDASECASTLRDLAAEITRLREREAALIRFARHLIDAIEFGPDEAVAGRVATELRAALEHGKE